MYWKQILMSKGKYFIDFFFELIIFLICIGNNGIFQFIWDNYLKQIHETPVQPETDTCFSGLPYGNFFPMREMKFG